MLGDCCSTISSNIKTLLDLVKTTSRLESRLTSLEFRLSSLESRIKSLTEFHFRNLLKQTEQQTNHYRKKRYSDTLVERPLKKIVKQSHCERVCDASFPEKIKDYRFNYFLEGEETSKVAMYTGPSFKSVIMKIVNKEEGKKEIAILKRLKEFEIPCIVEVIETIELGERIAIVTQPAGATLERLLQQMHVSFFESMEIFKQLITTFERIESLKLVHKKLDVSHICYKDGIIRILGWSHGVFRVQRAGFSENIYQLAELIFELCTGEIFSLNNFDTFIPLIQKRYPELEQGNQAKNLYKLLCAMHQKQKNLSYEQIAVCLKLRKRKNVPS